MFEELIRWVQLGMLTAALTISVLIWLFQQFPRLPGAAAGQWWARVQLGAALVATDSLDRAVHDAFILASAGSLLVCLVTRQVQPAVAISVIYLFFGIPVFTALQVLRLADELPREERSARLRASREAQRAAKRERRDR